MTHRDPVVKNIMDGIQRQKNLVGELFKKYGGDQLKVTRALKQCGVSSDGATGIMTDWAKHSHKAYQEAREKLGLAKQKRGSTPATPSL